MLAERINCFEILQHVFIKWSRVIICIPGVTHSILKDLSAPKKTQIFLLDILRVGVNIPTWFPS